METTRQEIFAQAAKRARQRFEELRVVPHSGTRGARAESIVKQFLIDHLPRRFDVGSGFIINKSDHISPQCDVIVYDAINCPRYRVDDEASIFPSTNVAAVVEVKSRLDREQLYDAAKKIRDVKRLASVQTMSSPGMSRRGGKLVGMMGCVFSFHSPLTTETLAEHYQSCVKEFGLGEHIDICLVLDRAIFGLWIRPKGEKVFGRLLGYHRAGKYARGSNLAAGVENYGEASLDAFLRILLAYLMHFHETVDHPGFDVASVAPNLTPMGTIK